MKDWQQHVAKRSAADGRLSISQLAREAGVSPYHVRKELDRRALKQAKSGNVPPSKASALDGGTSFARAAKATGLSVAQLAKLIPCSEDALVRYLRGQRQVPPSHLTIVRMALARGGDTVRKVIKEGADLHEAIEARHKRALKNLPDPC